MAHMAQGSFLDTSCLRSFIPDHSMGVSRKLSSSLGLLLQGLLIFGSMIGALGFL